ncbi:MAG: EamA family transporter [Acidobacteriota bacterium]|nr:EamA family transporter [Acidobacteriota bacterium]
MSYERKLRVKTLVMVFVMVVCATAGDSLLKRGMTHIGPVSLTHAGLLEGFRAAMTSGTIWLAILFLLGFMLSNMTALSWADYSYVMPAGAMGYAAVTLVGVFAFGETVSPRRWLGVALICAGVFLVGQTRPQTTAVMEAAR